MNVFRYLLTFTYMCRYSRILLYLIRPGWWKPLVYFVMWKLCTFGEVALFILPSTIVLVSGTWASKNEDLDVRENLWSYRFGWLLRMCRLPVSFIWRLQLVLWKCCDLCIYLDIVFCLALPKEHCVYFYDATMKWFQLGGFISSTQPLSPLFKNVYLSF